MPDEYGNLKGVGWTQRSSDAWERVFGRSDEEKAADLEMRARSAASAARSKRQAEAMRAWQDRGELPPRR